MVGKVSDTAQVDATGYLLEWLKYIVAGDNPKGGIWSAPVKNTSTVSSVTLEVSLTVPTTHNYILLQD